VAAARRSQPDVDEGVGEGVEPVAEPEDAFDEADDLDADDAFEAEDAFDEDEDEADDADEDLEEEPLDTDEVLEIADPDADVDAAEGPGTVAPPPEATFDDEDDHKIVSAVTGEDEDVEVEGLREGEFVCRSCYMAKRDTQLADPELLLCRDCA
jgi:hypothetical protein